jgi:hypothetical protein
MVRVRKNMFYEAVTQHFEEGWWILGVLSPQKLGKAL